jgi:hypothetical protein
MLHDPLRLRRRSCPLVSRAAGWFDVRAQKQRAARGGTRAALMFIAPLAKARLFGNHLVMEGGHVGGNSTR